ncbi:MAG: hypothetical protein ACKV2V_25950 [Blastocatellia bacterium]
MSHTVENCYISKIVTGIFLCLLLLGALLLTRYNFRHNRGDRRGAFRLAAFIFSARLLGWLFGANHTPNLFAEMYSFFWLAVSQALFLAGVCWVLYIALEPYVRRRWPVVLISWNRVLNGSLRDPLVSRDVLIGILFSAGLGTLDLLKTLLTKDFVDMGNFARDGLPDMRFLIASRFSGVSTITLVLLIYLFLLFVLRTLTRRQWLAAVIVVLLGCLLGLSASGSPLIGALSNGINFLLILTIMLRFGFFALAVYVNVDGLLSYPMTLHFSAWYTGPALLLAGAVLALAAYAFHTSLGGQKVFAGKLLED